MPANRIGYTQVSLGQLEILQEVITLGVFVPFAVFSMREPLKWDYLWAALCIFGAVYFVYRGGIARAAGQRAGFSRRVSDRSQVAERGFRAEVQVSGPGIRASETWT